MALFWFRTLKIRYFNLLSDFFVYDEKFFLYEFITYEFIKDDFLYEHF